jgi:hypothetical protein
MRLFTTLALFAFALAIAGCSETPVTTNNSNTTHEIEIVPNAINVVQFQSFTIKARMTNTALSDVNVVYNFGDGTETAKLEAGSDVTHFYKDIGTFTITVKAFDVFSDSLLATKTITANVTSGAHTASITPHVIDTTAECDDFGLLPFFSFIGSSNLPLQYARYYFDYGDGSVDSSISPDINASHHYEFPGTYKVHMNVRDNKWNFWASDSATVTVRLPAVTSAMIQSLTRVSVILAAGDPTNEQYVTGIRIANDSETTTNITTSTFATHYHLNFHGSTFTYADYQFSGTFNSDYSIVSCNVEALDSIKTDKGRHYKFNLKSLKIAAINGDIIVYKAELQPLTDFATIIDGVDDGIPYPAGDPDQNMIQRLTGGKKAPFAYVIFSRQ